MSHPAHPSPYGREIVDQSGVPIPKIADQLGHTDPAMTACVYLGRDLMGDKAAVAAFL